MKPNDRRFTLAADLYEYMKLAGVECFDLDAAAEAGHSCAPEFIDAKQNGLTSAWRGERVWVNPPYSDLRSWVEKAWSEITHGIPSVIVMLLPSNRTEQPFWQELIEPYRDGHGDHRHAKLTTHFIKGRRRFGNPAGVKPGSPRWSSVLLVWRLP